MLDHPRNSGALDLGLMRGGASGKPQDGKGGFGMMESLLISEMQMGIDAPET